MKNFQMLVWKGWTYTVASTFTSYDMDYHLWADVKDIVYQTKIRGITELKLKITDVIAATDEALLQRACQEIQYCLDGFCVNKGACIRFKKKLKSLSTIEQSSLR